MPEIEELCCALGGEPAVHGQYVPFSTLAPPWSSLSLTSFQKTIRACPSFWVRVTSTSPSFSSSSIACGASFQLSLRVRTERPLPFRV